MKHQGRYGSKGASTRNSARAKKKPAAMYAIWVGRSSVPRQLFPVLIRRIRCSTSLVENSHVHRRVPREPPL